MIEGYQTFVDHDTAYCVPTGPSVDKNTPRPQIRHFGPALKGEIKERRDFSRAISGSDVSTGGLWKVSHPDSFTDIDYT